MAARTAAQVASDLGRALPPGRTPRAGEAPQLEDGETYFFLSIEGEEGYARLAYDILMQHLPVRKMAGSRGSSLAPGREPGTVGLRGVCVIARTPDLPDGYRD